MEKINIEPIGTYFKIKPEKVGSCANVVLIKDGRATFYENEYSKTPTHVKLNSCAPVEELNQVIAVLETVRDVALGQLAEVAVPEEEILAPGLLVETCDKRYGIIKKVDWHAEKFLKRKDYQIQFPDGVGIFRRDEFKVVVY